MDKQVGEIALFHVAFQGPRVVEVQPTSTMTSKVALRVAFPVTYKGKEHAGACRNMQEHAREVYYGSALEVAHVTLFMFL